MGSWLSRSQRESPHPADRLSCPELPSSYPGHRWVSPCSGPNMQPPCGDKIKRQRLRSLQGGKHDFWSQCGEKHEKTAASSLKNFLKKQGQDIGSRENSLTSSSLATPQRPAYSHNQQAHDKMLNITDHQGTQINSTARQPPTYQDKYCQNQKPVLARTWGIWDSGAPLPRKAGQRFLKEQTQNYRATRQFHL